MSESRMRSLVVKELKPLHAMAVENPCLPGTPDVHFIDGWIELKWLRAWPKRPETPVRFDHYSQAQRAWALARRRAGGQCWFLVQCKREWILLDGAVMASFPEPVPKHVLIRHARSHSLTGLRDLELKFEMVTRLPRWVDPEVPEYE